MPFPAFLDACVLVPINLADVLLRLAEADTYRPLWSATVLDEVERTLTGRIGLDADKASDRVQAMRDYFPDAQVTGYDSLIPAMTNHPKDRHVLAAAVRAGAPLIVTANIDDFPEEALTPYDVQAKHPDDFLLDQLDLYPERTLRCLDELVAARANPTQTLGQFLTHLGKLVPDFCTEVFHRTG